MKRMVCFALVMLLILAGLPTMAEETAMETPVIVYGDVTGEGKVNAKDALLVLQYSVGVSTTDVAAIDHSVADVNRDGVTTPLDALEILKKSVGKPANFPNTLTVAGGTSSIRVGTSFDSYYTNHQKSAYQKVFTTIASRKGLGTYVEPLTAFDIANDIKTGKNAYDLLELSPSVALTLAKKNVLVNLKTAKTLDLSLFHSMATDYMTFGEKLYGVATKDMGSDPCLVFYNRALAQEVAPQWDVETLVEQKEWTTELFFEWLEKAKVVETDKGSTRVVRSGIADSGWGFYSLLAAQLAGPVAVREKNTFTVASYDQMMPAISKMRGLYRNSVWWNFSKPDAALQRFAEEKVMCMIAPASKASVIVKAAAFQVGMAPVPKAEGQSGYFSVHATPRVMAVPTNKEQRLEEIARWLNGVARYNGILVNDEIATLTRLGATSVMGREYKALLENAVWDYAALGTHFDVSEAAYHFTVKSFYGAVEGYQYALQKETQEFYDPLCK